MLNKTTSLFILAYGIIIMLLGYIGYREAASMASLYSGLIFGGLLVASGIAMLAGQKIGAYTALVTTILLTGVFSYRYAVTEKDLPAILAVLSAGMLLFLLLRFRKKQSD